LDLLLTKTYQVEMVISHQESLYILIVMWRKMISQRLLILNLQITILNLIVK
jgi:hypothetical protein